jgi:hypothetical protein
VNASQKREEILDLLFQCGDIPPHAREIISSLAYDLTPDEFVDWAERNEYYQEEEEEDNADDLSE